MLFRLCSKFRTKHSPERSSLINKIKSHHPNCPQYKKEPKQNETELLEKPIKRDNPLNALKSMDESTPRSLLVLKLPNAYEAANLVENLKVNHYFFNNISFGENS